MAARGLPVCLLVCQYTHCQNHTKVSKNLMDLLNPKVCRSCSRQMAGARCACADFCHPAGGGSVSREGEV